MEDSLEKLKCNEGLVKPSSLASESTSEANNVGNSSVSFLDDDDDLGAFEKHTTNIGSRLMKKMGYEGKGLGVNGQGIVNTIQVEELPRHARLGYVRKEET